MIQFLKMEGERTSSAYFDIHVDVFGEKFCLCPFPHCSCRIDQGVVFYAAFLAPISLMILFNLLVFIHVQWTLHKVAKRIAKENQKIGRHAQRVRAAMGIFFILGLGWLPGYALVALDKPLEVMQWVFSILVTFQGVVLFATQVQSKGQLVQRTISSVSLKSMMVARSQQTSSSRKSSSSKSYSQEEAPNPAVRCSSPAPIKYARGLSDLTILQDKTSLQSAPTPDPSDTGDADSQGSTSAGSKSNKSTPSSIRRVVEDESGEDEEREHCRGSSSSSSSSSVPSSKTASLDSASSTKPLTGRER